MHSAPSETLCRSNWNLRPNGRLQFWYILTIVAPKCYRCTFTFFEQVHSNSSAFYFLESSLGPSILDIIEAMSMFFQERHNHSENCITVNVNRIRQKIEIPPVKEGYGLSFLRTELGHILRNNIGNDPEWCWEEQYLASQNFLRPCMHTLYYVIHRPDWVNIWWQHEGPFAAIFSF